MRDRLRSSTAILALGLALTTPGRAVAQVHWEAGGELGAMQRFTTGSAPGAASPGPGPVGEIYAHVALFPMIRLGPYVAHDISPRSGAPARQMTEAGLQAKLSPPLLTGPWQTWGFLGVGYTRTYEPSHRFATNGPANGPPTSEFVPGAGGGLLDLPLGVGLGYRFSRPWEVFAELAGRFGIALAGSMYERGACGCAEPYAGKDSFALSLSVGLNLNQ